MISMIQWCTDNDINDAMMYGQWFQWYNDVRTMISMIQWYNDTLIQWYQWLQWYNEQWYQWYNDVRTMIQWYNDVHRVCNVCRQAGGCPTVAYLIQNGFQTNSLSLAQFKICALTSTGCCFTIALGKLYNWNLEIQTCLAKIRVWTGKSVCVATRAFNTSDVSFVGFARTIYIYIYGVYTVYLAGKSPS